MAKTARLKNSNKAPSLHSRASRRASSPSLNLDRSLTSLKPPSTTTNVLAPSRGGGVVKSNSKGNGKGRVLKRKQKIRLERGKDKAEAVGEKVARKRGMGIAGEGRNTDWDELNGKIGVRKGKRRKGREGKRGGGTGGGSGSGSGDEGWEDEGVDGDEGMDGDVDGDVDGDGDAGKGLDNRETVEGGVVGGDTMKALEEEIL